MTGRVLQAQEFPRAARRHDAPYGGNRAARLLVVQRRCVHLCDALAQPVSQVVVLGFDDRHEGRTEDELARGFGEDEIAHAGEALAGVHVQRNAGEQPDRTPPSGGAVPGGRGQ